MTGVKAVQLHGDEKLGDFEFIECPLLKSATLDHLTETARAWPAETMLLLDAADRVKRGGTGRRSRYWNKAAVAARNHRFVLAGGLTPLNVEEPIPLGAACRRGRCGVGRGSVARDRMLLQRCRRFWRRTASTSQRCEWVT